MIEFAMHKRSVYQKRLHSAFLKHLFRQCIRHGGMAKTLSFLNDM